MFSFHSGSPIWISEGSTVSPGNWRQRRGLEQCRLSESVLPACDHGMPIRHRRYWYSTGRRCGRRGWHRDARHGCGRGGRRHGRSHLDRYGGRVPGVDGTKSPRGLRRGQRGGRYPLPGGDGGKPCRGQRGGRGGRRDAGSARRSRRHG